MSIIGIHGHEELRARLAASAGAGTLPSSLLFHGPRGAGKQRLALWLAQLLVCERDNPPCGDCQNCRYAQKLVHPDIHWYFPQPRPKDADPDLEDVREDYRDAIATRAESGGIYAAPSGSEGIFVATIRAIVQEAAVSPALAARKIFIIGDAERMVSQEGADQAANAFLKLLEEPPGNTTVIITSSEPGALLPTIRSRTIAVRVAPISDGAMKGFLAEPAVAKELGGSGAKFIEEKMRGAAGRPGTLFGTEARDKAMTTARRLLEAAAAPHSSARHAAALSVGATGARGSFADILDALLLILGERMRAALHDGNERRALAVSRASDLVGEARIRASGNVNPQLLASGLLRELSAALAISGPAQADARSSNSGPRG